MNKPNQLSRLSDRKPFVLPKVEEHPAMTVLTQGAALVSGQELPR
jgi:hypothetical protein